MSAPQNDTSPADVAGDEHDDTKDARKQSAEDLVEALTAAIAAIRLRHGITTLRATQTVTNLLRTVTISQVFDKLD